MTQLGSPPNPPVTIKFHCARCGQLLRAPDAACGKNARCPECRLLMRVPPPATARDSPAVSIDETRPGLPWEATGGKSFGALLQTVQLVCLRPSEAFSRMKQGGSAFDPILYCALWMWLGTLGTIFWDTVLTLGYLTFVGATPERFRMGMLSVLVMAAAYLFVAVPLGATLYNLMVGGILHLCLLLCGGSRRPFATSFRLVCYCQGSLMWLMFLPGGALGIGVWNLILNIYAIHKAHEVPMGRAVVAAALPILAMMILVGLLVVLFVGWIVYLILYP